MGRCYSLDLRERVTKFVSSGASRRAADCHFGVSESFAIKLVQLKARSGYPAPVRQCRPPGGGKLSSFKSFLIAEVEAKPDITMPEVADRLMTRPRVSAAPAVLSRLLHLLN